MILIFQVTSVFLAAVAMSLALAHALELPGKLRLDRRTYAAVQPIYYPGFTVGGGLGEGLGMVATAALLLMTPKGGAAFWWTLAGLIALAAMHVTYWVVTHPVNKFWLKDQTLKGFGSKFFGFDLMGRRGPSGDGEEVWRRARDRWEYSHVLRAALAAAALLALIVAVAI